MKPLSIVLIALAVAFAGCGGSSAPTPAPAPTVGEVALKHEWQRWDRLAVRALDRAGRLLEVGRVGSATIWLDQAAAASTEQEAVAVSLRTLEHHNERTP
jgi:hypothetical protein